MRALLFNIVLIVTALGALGAEDRLLRLQASIDAPVVARLPGDSEAARQAAPVLDSEKAALGRMWTEYAMPLRGFVPQDSLSKNFEVGESTPVRARPAGAASIITTVESGDRFTPLEAAAESDWVEVRFEKPVAVYFRKGNRTATGQANLPTVEPTEPVAAPTDAPRESGGEPATETAPSSRADISSFDPLGRVGATDPRRLPPENVVWAPPAENPRPGSGAASEAPLEGRSPPPAPIPARTAPRDPSSPGASENGRAPAPRERVAPRAESEPILVLPESQAAIQPPKQPRLQAGTPTRLLSGKLVRKLPRSGPRYPLRLLDTSGQRIAYVDMSRIFITDIRPFLDREVIIRGELQPIVPGSDALILYARTLRRAP